jgi:L-rhamnose isomerase
MKTVYSVQVVREAMVSFDTEVEAETEKEAIELAEQEALDSMPDDWHMLEHEWRMKDFYETYVEDTGFTKEAKIDWSK